MSKSLKNRILSIGAFAALRHRNYAIYAPFAFASSIGYWVQRIAVQWLVWDLTGSFAWLGIIVFLEAIAILCVTPFAGDFADRFDRTVLARIVRAVTALTALCIGVCHLAGILTLPLLIVFVVIAAIADSVWTPVRLAVVPNLVPRPAIPSAITFGAMSFHSAHFIGPAIAGLMIYHLGVSLTFIVNSVLLTSVVIAFFVIKLVHKPEAVNRRSGFVERMGDALSYVRANPGMLRLLLLMAMISFCIRPYKEFYAGFTDGIFSRGAEGLALVAAASGLGALIAALSIGFTAQNPNRTNGIIKSSAFSVLALLVFALSPHFWGFVAGSFLLGLSLTWLGITSQIMIQSAVDDNKRGRVMGLWGMQMKACPAIGAFVIGAAAEAWDVRMAMAAFAAVFVVGAMVFVWPQRSSFAALAQKS